MSDATAPGNDEPCTSQVGLVRSFTVKTGNWYVRIVGDFYQLLEGSVLEANTTGALEPIITDPGWTTCSAPVTRESLSQQKDNGMGTAGTIVGKRRALLQVEEGAPTGAGFQVMP
jgi:hypothetical protein